MISRARPQTTRGSSPPVTRPYRRAMGVSLGLHALILLSILFLPVLLKAKPYIQEEQVLMAEMVELEPAPEPPQPAPEPPPPAPEPPPAKPDRKEPEPEEPNSLPDAESKPKPPTPKTEDKRRQKIQQLREKREARREKRVTVDRETYIPPSPPRPDPTAPPKRSSAVRVKGKPFPFDYYLILVRNALWEAWRPPKAAAPEGISAIVSFQINRDGSVASTSVAVDRSSGLPVYDQSCIRAVQNAQFPPLPQDYTGRRLSLDCVFRSKER